MMSVVLALNEVKKATGRGMDYEGIPSRLVAELESRSPAH